MKKSKMVCNECGVELNQHAEKLNYSAAMGDPAKMDPDFGAAIEEQHTCPACGQSKTRFSEKK